MKNYFFPYNCMGYERGNVAQNREKDSGKEPIDDMEQRRRFYEAEHGDEVVKAQAEINTRRRHAKKGLGIYIDILD